jgi:hypothetical protein
LVRVGQSDHARVGEPDHPDFYMRCFDLPTVHFVRDRAMPVLLASVRVADRPLRRDALEPLAHPGTLRTREALAHARHTEHPPSGEDTT